MDTNVQVFLSDTHHNYLTVSLTERNTAFIYAPTLLIKFDHYFMDSRDPVLIFKTH